MKLQRCTTFMDRLEHEHLSAKCQHKFPHKFPYHSVFLPFSNVCYHGNLSRLVCCISGLSVYASLVLEVLEILK